MAVPPAWRHPNCHTMAVTAVKAPEPATWTGTRASGTPVQYWTMPTPRGSYFKQLQECFEQLGGEPKVGIVCETFSSCISLVVKSDFLSILPVELGNAPLMADKLLMIPIREVLPTATYYLIQRRDTRQTPLTASLITLFRRQSRQLFP